jgi:putative pyruvate formate lyase activating enzyme
MAFISFLIESRSVIKTLEKKKMFHCMYNTPMPDLPSYLRLQQSGELQRRAAQAVAGLANCQSCPRKCRVNRLDGETGTCRTGRQASVSSYFPHLGEEDCLRGWRGSGTIFFTQCNLRCVFCQNFDISQEERGTPVSAQRLAEIMLELQAMGCHNINFVTPSHVVPQILEALPLAVEAGLRLPLVYNTSAYDSLTTLRLLDGVMDIYMPDFKIWDSKIALKYLLARDYPQVARQAFKEMQRQVGVLQTDSDGLARRGLLVRHLVMPANQADTRAILIFIARELSPDTCINIMAQYHPAGKVNSEKFSAINRRIASQEYQKAIADARAAGLHRFA